MSLEIKEGLEEKIITISLILMVKYPGTDMKQWLDGNNNPYTMYGAYGVCYIHVYMTIWFADVIL